MVMHKTRVLVDAFDGARPKKECLRSFTGCLDIDGIKYKSRALPLAHFLNALGRFMR